VFVSASSAKMGLVETRLAIIPGAGRYIGCVVLACKTNVCVRYKHLISTAVLTLTDAVP